MILSQIKDIAITPRRHRHGTWAWPYGREDPGPLPRRRQPSTRAVRPGGEPLEGRRLLAAGLNPFASFEGAIEAPGQRDSIPVELRAADFPLPRSGRVLLALQAQAVGGGNLIPATPNVIADGGARPLILGRFAGARGTKLAALAPGDYSLTVQGVRGSTGAYRLDVALAGDVNGDFGVDQQDLDAIRAAIRHRGAGDTTADVNGDRRVNFLDLRLAQRNLGAATEIRPLTLTAALAEFNLGPNGVVTNTKGAVVGQTTPGQQVRLVQGLGNPASREATADTSGRFRLPVGLAVGETRLLVQASDSFGQHAQVQLVATRPAAPETTQHSATVMLFNNWGTTITNVTLVHSVGIIIFVPQETLQLASMSNGGSAPLNVVYTTGFLADEDGWSLQFTDASGTTWYDSDCVRVINLESADAGTTIDAIINPAPQQTWTMDTSTGGHTNSLVDQNPCTEPPPPSENRLV